MKTGDLDKHLAALKAAQDPEDVFGPIQGLAEVMAENINRQFRDRSRDLHPDRYVNKRPALVYKAQEAFALLNGFRQAALLKVEQGIYGQRGVKPNSKPDERVEFRTAKYSYIVTKRIHSGGTCGVFRGVATHRSGVVLSVLVRVPHTIADNDLMEREARAFKLIGDKLKKFGQNHPDSEETAKKMAMRLPGFMETIKLQGPGGTKVINAFALPDQHHEGWFTLEDIRREYPDGVDPRVMTFIWNRLLEGLTLAHSAGVVHGAITPNHMLVHAKDHLGQLFDWTASCQIGKGQTVPYRDDRYQGYFPEEIVKSGTATPSTDIFMSAWCMVYLLGGDPTKKVIPVGVPQPIRDFLNRCLQPTARYRPKTVDRAYLEYREIAKQVFGKPRFVDLIMKGGSA